MQHPSLFHRPSSRASLRMRWSFFGQEQTRLLEPSAKLIGPHSVGRRILEALGYVTSRSSRVSYACVGYGTNGAYQALGGDGKPCDKLDFDLFYASPTITIGNGAHTPFWDSTWLNGSKPMDSAPLVYRASSQKNASERSIDGECLDYKDHPHEIHFH